MCWHKWTEWKQYLWEGKPYNELRKYRHCIKCGKEQDIPY